MFIGQGMADAAICGAVDFPLVEPIVAGFATMNGAYRPKEGEEPAAARGREPPLLGRPAGVRRLGGGGCIVIASRAFAEAHGLAFDSRTGRMGMTSDAYHVVAPNLATVTRCIAESIRHAGITPADIDAVNAHGASTKVGDKVEADALREVFGSRFPRCRRTSRRSGTPWGRRAPSNRSSPSRACAGDVLLPTINYRPDPEIDLDCVAEGARSLEQEFVLKNAFGFGGCNACLVFRRVN